MRTSNFKVLKIGASSRKELEVFFSNCFINVLVWGAESEV